MPKPIHHESTSVVERIDTQSLQIISDLLAAAKLACLNFERANNAGSGRFLGDDDHEAWTALQKAIDKAEGR